MNSLATTFLHHWETVCLENSEAVTRDWRYCPKFTSLVFDGPDALIAKVAAHMGLQHYCGYYSIDAILFDHEGRVQTAPPNSTWVRRIRVAFEHENDFYSGLYKEVSHLMLTDCDLRVLVTYPGDDPDLPDELDHLGKLIAGSDRAAACSLAGSFLFIAGRLHEDTSPVSFSWEAYVFDQAAAGGWRKI